ncbi:MAG: TMEM175 family protein [Chloroflexota bacterium]
MMDHRSPTTTPGITTSRAEAFSDGVFAVAITLLVFNVSVPTVHRGALQQALLDQWPSYASYAVSFLTIGIIWVNHHATFSRIERVDRPFLFINLLLLMTVSFIPFPTNLLSHYIQSGPDARVAAVIYASTMTAMSLSFSGIWIYAVHRGLLHSGRVDRQRARSTIPRFGAGMVLYGFSIVVAFFSPLASLAFFGILAVFYVFDQQGQAEASADGAGNARA